MLLHKAVEKVVGSFPINNQTIGDCVSQGEAGACQVLICTDIVLRGEAEEWRGLVATEPIYAGSRVEIGGGRISGDGSVGAWAARWVVEYGVLVRRKYEVDGIEFDLTEYDGDRARAWGRRGVGCPNGLELIAKEHPVKTTSLCTGYDQARDSIANGYPVTVASNRGFNDVRDSEGFLRPSGTWSHEMYFCGVDDEYSAARAALHQLVGHEVGQRPETSRPAGRLVLGGCGRGRRHAGGWRLVRTLRLRRVPQPEPRLPVDLRIAMFTAIAACRCCSVKPITLWPRLHRSTTTPSHRCDPNTWRDRRHSPREETHRTDSREMPGRHVRGRSQAASRQVQERAHRAWRGYRRTSSTINTPHPVAFLPTISLTQEASHGHRRARTVSDSPTHADFADGSQTREVRRHQMPA